MTKPLRPVPTAKQVQDEIKRLKAAKPKLRRYDIFGNDHYAEIDAQIEVLEEIMDEEEVYAQHWPENCEGPALEAAQWLIGESEEDSLIDGWKGLIR